MAALAIPALEGAWTALVAVLGIGAGAIVVSEEMKRRQKAASEAGSGTASQTATRTRTRPCDKCPPDCGLLVERRWNMSPAAREYQAHATGFAPFIEWAFAGIDFDGFSSAECMLKEAKSRYDQFLTEGDDSELEPKKFFKAFELKMLPQAKVQARVAEASQPTRLTWYFQGPKTYEYMALKVMVFPPLVAVYLP